MAGSRKRNVLVTGCTPGGIGHALCLEFQKQGCHVIATARNPDVLKPLAEQGLSVAQLDVTDQASVDACKIEVEKLTGGLLDIVVNNAGRPHVIPAIDADMDDVQKTFDANVFGPMRVVNTFIPLLIAARGLVLNISSTSTQVPYLFGAIYSSTKGAIEVWSRALRLELKPLGVRVMVSMTGTVKSNFASGPHRSLPSASLYQPVNDIFQWRLTFSQNHGTCPTDTFAQKVVRQALRGESWLGGLIGGTPYWYWCGGLGNLVWLTTLFPKVMGENIMTLYWELKTGGMARRLREATAKKST